jgi:hypothetical protein
MKNFIEVIDSFLNGKILFDEFFRLISAFYGSQNPEWNKLKKSEQDFVYEIYEKSTYTAEGLPKNDLDRKYGVIDEIEFKKWVGDLREKNIKFWNVIGSNDK